MTLKELSDTCRLLIHDGVPPDARVEMRYPIPTDRDKPQGYERRTPILVDGDDDCVTIHC